MFQEIKAEQEQLGLNSPWVFPNPATGKPYRRDADTAWYNALKRAGLQRGSISMICGIRPPRIYACDDCNQWQQKWQQWRETLFCEMCKSLKF